MSFDARIAGNIYSLPGDLVAFTASGTITKGQVVKIAGAMTVAAASAVTDKVIGVAVTNASNGGTVTVAMGCPIVWLTASGTVNAGDVLRAATGGAVASTASGTLAYAVGYALEGTSSGGVFRVAIAPFVWPAS
jgi:hypothetical protein